MFSRRSLRSAWSGTRREPCTRCRWSLDDLELRALQRRRERGHKRRVSAVIAGLEPTLARGGIAQILGNWEYTETDGLDRVRGWLLSTGLDPWVVERERQRADLYAEMWIRDRGTTPGAQFDEFSSAWLDDFRSRGVTEIGFGYLTLRSPVGTALAAVVGACDGTLSLAAIVGAVAQLLEVDEDAMLAEILPEVRELVETEMLLAESTTFTGRTHVPPT